MKEKTGFPLEDVLSAIDNPITRRNFIKGGALTIVGISGLSWLNLGKECFALDNKAIGVVLCDPVLCAGCRTCEAICSSKRYGFVSPTLSLLTVDRKRQQAVWTTGLYYAETCHHCAETISTPWCVEACPESAISIAAKGAYGDTRARVIDETACVGCKSCYYACPYGMIVFDEGREVATKCDLCSGNPYCVQACPVGALSYYKPWVDKIPNQLISDL